MRILETARERIGAGSAPFRLDFSIAFRNVVRQRRRSLVGMSAIAAGVVALLLAAGFFEWNYDAMREGTIRSHIGHIQVVKPGYLDAGASDPFSFLIPESTAARELIEAFPQVDTVAPRLAFNGLVSVGESTVSFMGEGVDPERERRLSGAVSIVEGRNLFDRAANEVLVGRGLAHTLGLKVGQNVVLVVNTPSGGVNARDVAVVGTFSTVTKAYDDYAIRVPLKTAQALLRVEGVHSWLVLLRQTSLTDATLKKMNDKIPSTGIELVPWYRTAAADFYNKTVVLFSRQVLVVKLMIAIIIVLSISNTMMTNVRERIAEIGTCMALGDTRRVVLRRFLAEGVVLGLLGGGLGSILGIVLAHLISYVGIPMPPPPGMTTGYVAGIIVTPRLVLDAMVLSVGTAFVAGLYPSWRASSLEIVDALRHAR